MARAKDPEKRQAILDAAVREMAHVGLGASTARISRAAAIAEGTLFTYFPSKEDLLNALYLELKSEVFRRINLDFPQGAPLRERTRHIWMTYLQWAIDRPDDRKVSMLLHTSDDVTSTTRACVAAARGAVERTMAEVDRCGVFQQLPRGFASLAMPAMQEAVMDAMGRAPRQKKVLMERGFEGFWRMAE